MIIPGANESPSTDHSANTNGGEELAFVITQVPPDFVGEVEVHIYGKVTDIASTEKGIWKGRLRQQVSRDGNAAWMPLTGLGAVQGYSFVSPLGLQFNSAFSSVVGDDPSVWKMKVVGVDGMLGAFTARCFLSGAIIDG